jgi:aspartyl protease family protein
VSGVRLGIGLVGGELNDALLGQSFLSKFEVILTKDQMVLRPRQL